MAGLGRKVFTAGDVLTASDVQNYLMDQTVMNFAGTAARSSAIATPTDGMVTYNQSNDQVEAYNGSAWIGVGGLQLIKTQAVGTTVASVSVTGAFSAAYDEYKIIYSRGLLSAGSVNMLMTIGSISSGYFTSQVYQNAASATQVTGNQASAGAWVVGLGGNQYVKYDIDISNPFATTAKTFNFRFSNYDTVISTMGTGGGVTIGTTSCTSFVISPSSGTMTGGTIYVYGYAK